MDILLSVLSLYWWLKETIGLSITYGSLEIHEGHLGVCSIRKKEIFSDLIRKGQWEVKKKKSSL